MPEESPHARFDRLKKQLQDSILRDYPNPERQGCPGNAAVRELAHRPLDYSLEGSPNWQHLTHCSECYREFLDIREMVPMMLRDCESEELVSRFGKSRNTISQRFYRGMRKAAAAAGITR